MTCVIQFFDTLRDDLEPTFRFATELCRFWPVRRRSRIVAVPGESGLPQRREGGPIREDQALSLIHI